MKNIHPIALLSVFLNLILVLFLAVTVRNYPYVLFETTEASINRQPKADADKLFTLVQNWRTENGYKAHTLDKMLCGYAYKRAMEVSTIFTHELFAPFEYNPNFIQMYENMGENLGRIFTPTDNPSKETMILDGWLNSPPHLKTLKADYTNSCIACYKDNCVQIFANFKGTKNTPPTQ